MLGRDAVAEEHCRTDDHQCDRQCAAEPVANDCVRPVHANVFWPPLLLDPARRVEVHLVRRHRRSEQADHEVEVQGRVVLGDMRDEALADLAQSGPDFTAATANTSMQSPP